MSRAAEAKKSSTMCVVRDCEVRLSRFSLHMWMYTSRIQRRTVSTKEFSISVGVRYNLV